MNEQQAWCICDTPVHCKNSFGITVCKTCGRSTKEECIQRTISHRKNTIEGEKSLIQSLNWLKENWETVRRGVDIVQGELFGIFSDSEYERITTFLKMDSIETHTQRHEATIEKNKEDIEKASKL